MNVDDTPAGLLAELAKRFDALPPLADDVSSRDAQVLASIAMLVRHRLSVISHLVEAGDVSEAAVLTRTLFEWAALAVWLATDDPEERLQRAKRFTDFERVLRQKFVEEVGTEQDVVALQAEIAAGRSDSIDSHMIFKALAGKSLKGFVKDLLPDGSTWERFYKTTYFELSRDAHPSMEALRHRRPTSSSRVAVFAANLAQISIEAACSVGKVPVPNAQDILDRLIRHHEDLLGGLLAKPRPSFAIPEPSALEAVCEPFHVKGLALFGSAVRSELSWASDVDLLVEFEPGTAVSLFTLSDLEHRLSSLFHRTVDLAIKSELRKELRDTILSEARPIYGAL